MCTVVVRAAPLGPAPRPQPVVAADDRDEEAEKMTVLPRPLSMYKASAIGGQGIEGAGGRRVKFVLRDRHAAEDAQGTGDDDQKGQGNHRQDNPPAPAA